MSEESYTKCAKALGRIAHQLMEMHEEDRITIAEQAAEMDWMTTNYPNIRAEYLGLFPLTETTPPEEVLYRLREWLGMHHVNQNPLLKRDIGEGADLIESQQATITNQSAEIDHLHDEADEYRATITRLEGDNNTWDFRYHRETKLLQATITERDDYIKFLEDEWVNTEDHRDAKEAYAALKEKPRIAMYDEDSTWEPPEEQGRDWGIPIQEMTMSDIKIKRLRELVNAITGHNFDTGEFSMRIPADEDHDADLVISWAATKIESLTTTITKLKGALTRIADDSNSFGSWDQGDCELDTIDELNNLRAYARAALKEEDDHE